MTNPLMENIVKGYYNPASYQGSALSGHHHDIICGLNQQVSADSLHHYLVELDQFHTRHTYSDTVSDETGIGAARRWALKRMEQIRSERANRLSIGYLEFDYPGGLCGDGRKWKNVLAVLPGTDTANHQLVIIEAHLDTRCEDPCDINCLAAGMEDNGSGSALVLELTRVLSRYKFTHTLVFMLTIGEEQGLYGAKAMAKYCKDNNIAVKAVLNNDVVGGIRCGETSSPPGCDGEGTIDSTQLRIFSDGSFTAPHRSLARSINLFYQEKLTDVVQVPMTVSVMDQEDRTGRGGDHIPFRQEGYPSIRFTAANEHGDAHPDNDYQDRQHSVRDVLGVDHDGDGTLDEFYVDFNYLARNTVINGMAATLLASGPATPEFELLDEPAGLRVNITGNFAANYRVGVRSLQATNAFDAIYRSTSTSMVVPGLSANQFYRISVAAVDDNGVMSPFSGEILKKNQAATTTATQDPLDLKLDCSISGVPILLKGNEFELSCRPNPGPGYTTIVIRTSSHLAASPATIRITDVLGKVVREIPFELQPGKVNHTFDVKLDTGNYFYSLVKKGEVLDTKSLVIH